VFDTFEGFATDIFQHKLIQGLTEKSRSADYIPANVFSTVVFDIVYGKFQAGSQKQGENQLPDTYDFDRLEEALLSPHNPLPKDMNRYLLQALQESKNSGGSLTLIKKRLEDWYENAMERIIGTYKKKTRYITWVAAVFVTLFANADTVALSKYLKSNPEVTTKLVQAAQQSAQDSVLYKTYLELAASIEKSPQSDSLKKEIGETIAGLKKTQELNNTLYRSLYMADLPLGWENGIPPYKEEPGKDKKEVFYLKWIFFKITGLLITALALTLGAPFWFDTINKLVNIRSSGNKPEDTASNKKSTAIG